MSEAQFPDKPSNSIPSGKSVPDPSDLHSAPPAADAAPTDGKIESSSSSFSAESHPETYSEKRPEINSDSLEESRLRTERPFIKTRTPLPRDPVQPRGVSSITRIPPGARSRSAYNADFGRGIEINDGKTSTEDVNNSSQNSKLNSDENQTRNVSDSSASQRPENAAREERPNAPRSWNSGPNRGSDLRNFRERREYSQFRSGPENPSDGRRGGENFGGGRSGRPRTDRQIQSGNVSGRPYKPFNPSAGGGYNGGGYNNNGGYNNGGAYNNDSGYNNGGGYNGRPRRRNQDGYSAFNPAFPETSGGRQHKEPLSLAEELAEEMSRGHRSSSGLTPDTDSMKPGEVSLWNESVGRLQKLSMPELIAEARRFEIGVPDEENAKKHDIIFRILKEKIKLNGLLYGEGTLEILPDGFGFLRSTEFHYLSCPDDIYVSPSQIRRFGLKTGTIVSGQIRPPKENERYFALLRVEAINYHDPNEFSRKKNFDDLTPMYPHERLRLESDPDEIEMRVLDMMVPVGFGQRGTIVSPPRAGKTVLLQKIARAALKNYPELYVFILLIDERPEEVTDMRKQVKGLNCEVISSTFDEPTMRHIQVAEMVLEKAKRMVEYGQNVVILLDSLTRLARAWNTETPASDKTLTGGLDANALQIPKRFFGSARCVEEGGSLTILATVLTETNSAMDDVIAEEFQGTGNLEVVLDKRLLEQRVWPTMDLTQSGTRRDEMLMSEDEYRKIIKLRHVLCELNPVDAMELLTNRLRKTKSNAEFLEGLK